MPTSRKVALVVVLALLAAAPSAQAFDPAYEARNYSKLQERFRFLTSTPAYQALLREKGAKREAQLAQIRAADAERDSSGNLCQQRMDGCAGDVRLYDWTVNGSGIALPVLFTARNGSTLSGHVWATAQGPARRPGVVFTSGSVQAPEELYWFAAQTLARAGYVVLTYDIQGQGYSDTFGEGVDRNDGVPSQSGPPFFDSTEDALDFFFSAPDALYRPRRSCTTGTDHAPKQAARFKRGVSSGYNPFHALLEPRRVGLIGQSLGAAAVSYIGQIDERVQTIVGLDNLAVPRTSNFNQTLTCDAGTSPRPAAPPITKPALGIAADYPLNAEPKRSDPDPLEKSAASLAYTKAGVDSGQIVIRGGGHFEYGFIPNPGFGATLRGEDMTAFYELAWMDKYLKGDPTADARLLSDRWRSDARSREIDPDADANMFSRYYRSRLDIALDGGGRLLCETLRDGCALRPDGGPVPYDFLAAANEKDAAAGPGRDAARPWVASTDPAGAAGVPPAANRLLVAGGQQPPGANTGLGCRDVTRPVTRFRSRVRLSRGRIVVRGTATDRACGRRGRLLRVAVAVARVTGTRCRYLRADGSFGRPASCRFPRYIEASGTTSWSLIRRARFARGPYRIYARGIDAAGNAERRQRARNVTTLRVR